MSVAMGMDDPSLRKPLALIAGPTASGKTALALELAERGSFTIVNADSAQVYREIPILSAQPSDAEMAQVPHRLFGYRSGRSGCSAADWAHDAKIALEETWNAGRIPLLVGGTGLYIRTLLDGIAPIPEVDPDIRDEVRAMPVEAAFAALETADPAMATRLQPADRSRIQRALEVIRSTGCSIASWREEKTGGIGDNVSLGPLILLPDRDWLYDRCDRRFAQMMDSGAEDEVRRLLTMDLPSSSPLLRAIGLREIAGWLKGELDREEAIARGQQATRRYAKRQYTWFRHQVPPDWPRTDLQNHYNLNDIFETLLRY